MNLTLMKTYMIALAERHKKYKSSEQWIEIGTKELDLQFLNNIVSLHYLMQFPEFFEVLLNEGFVKEGNQWSFASPIRYILKNFYSFARVFPKGRFELNSLHDFKVDEVSPNFARGLDHFLSDKLVTMESPDEKFELHLEDIVPNNTSPQKPSPSTLANLLAPLAKTAVYTGAKGWFEFCKKRGIHPSYNTKTNYNDWHTIGNPEGDGVQKLKDCKEFQESFEKVSLFYKNQEITSQSIEDPTKRLENMKSEPELICLYDKIDDMYTYGKNMNHAKGLIVQLLARDLRKKVDTFLGTINESTSIEEFEQFKKEFILLAHSQDYDVIPRHRALWKPIVANIIIALTGIGFITLMANIAIQLSKTDKHFTTVFKNGFFFTKTRSEHLVKDIDTMAMDLFPHP